MAIENLEKILNISLTEYCASVGKNPGDFRLKGIHVRSGKTDEDILYTFSEKVPDGAEVVVNYNVAVTVAYMGRTLQYASGTALIPKK